MSQAYLAANSKEMANRLFKAARFEEAAAKYSEAIEADPTDPSLYTNRSTAHANQVSTRF